MKLLHLHCRLYTAFASADPRPQEEDSTWQAAFKLSYDVGCSLLWGRQQLPSSHVEAAIGGSQLMALALQHQELVAPPKLVAEQGTPLGLN